DTVVCIIEAMKVFNEIPAECSGTVSGLIVWPTLTNGSESGLARE
ncbi:MAG: biotin/lipoyl-containing protein, partial [Planctomycetota bacterium]